MKASIAFATIVVLGSAAALGQSGSTTPALYPVVFVDVQVVADDGLKIPDLGPARFAVSIDGTRRRVVSAQGSPIFSTKLAADGSNAVLDSSRQYRLGIEPEASDHDGNAHQLIVTVDADGRKVHASRRQPMCGCRHGPPPRRRLRPRRPGRARRRRRRTSRPGNVFGAALKRSPPQRTQPGAPRAHLRQRAPPSFQPSDRRRPLATRTVFDDLFARYASGDTGVLLRELPRAVRLRTRPSGPRAARLPAGALSRGRRRRATFALEIALTAFARTLAESPDIPDRRARHRHRSARRTRRAVRRRHVSSSVSTGLRWRYLPPRRAHMRSKPT